MDRNAKLTIKFYTSKEGKPCAFIEERNTGGFHYELKESSMIGLFTYIFSGQAEEFDQDPKASDDLIEEGEDFQVSVLRSLVDSDQPLRFTPLFRERPGKISAILSSQFGQIIFRVDRTEGLMEFLNDHKVLA